MIKIGCDPELFALDTKTNTYISVHNLLKGTKTEPFKVRKGAYQVDGLAAEFNIEPAETKVAFCKNIALVRRYLETALQKANPDLILKAVPSVDFSAEYFFSLPMEALELGCEPDYNAYTMSVNPKPNGMQPMRTGSGHVHVGWTSGEDIWTDKHLEKCADVVKALDVVLYQQSSVWDDDTRRRELYGRPGDFRPKHYGVEYRTLSNKWVEESWTQQFVFDATKATVERVFDGVDISSAVNPIADFKEYLSSLDRIGIPTVRNYAPEGVINYAKI